MSTTLPNAPASPTTIDLAGLPEPVIQSIKQLVASIRTGGASTPPAVRKPLIGRFEHLGLTFTKEEIDEAQREMWANFPRDFPATEQK